MRQFSTWSSNFHLRRTYISLVFMIPILFLKVPKFFITRCAIFLFERIIWSSTEPRGESNNLFFVPIMVMVIWRIILVARVLPMVGTEVGHRCCVPMLITTVIISCHVFIFRCTLFYLHTQCLHWLLTSVRCFYDHVYFVSPSTNVQFQNTFVPLSTWSLLSWNIISQKHVCSATCKWYSVR